MNEMFDVYERQYCELSSNLSKKCSDISKLTGEQRKKKIQEVNSGLDEANSLIRRMDLEARSLPVAQRTSLLSKIREYNADLTVLKRKLASDNSFSSVENQGAVEDRSDGYRNDPERARLLANMERLNNTTERIRDGKKTLLETEEIGVSILQDLHQQRQTLLNTKETLHGLDDSITKARQILTSMGRRMNRNKWLTAFIIFILICAIAAVAYFKWNS